MSKERSRIHILDQHTANQIAAGEVVERPYSVIKELVENSLDAGADRISVRIFDASLEKMQVTDNGSGMTPEELRMSVLRHATSKISSVSDLDKLQTLGFRGEALPSIGSVSHLTVISRPKGEDTGYSISVKGGKADIPQPAPSRQGTTVVVDRLFYNTPARKKFLKSPRTELGLISDLIAKYIVAYPSVAFSLLNGSHQIYNSSGSGDPRTALFEAYGRDIADQMLEFEYGFISPPSLNRSSRSNYNFFINGRPVRSRELNNTVDQAYFSFLPEGRHPIVFMFLELDPEALDVNVHPGKLEVKFRDFRPLKEKLMTAVGQVLGRSKGNAPILSSGWQDHMGSIPASPRETAAYEPASSEAVAAAESFPSYGNDLYQVLYAKAMEMRQEDAADIGAPVPEEPVLEQTALFEAKDTSDRIIYSDLTPLGQFAGTFIICTGGEYLYVIDQHAAAERILYEKIARRAKTDPGSSDQLAVPIVVELSHAEAMQLTDRILELRDNGFILEHFGDNAFVIRGVPLWYSGDDPEQLLRLFLEELSNDTADIARIRKDELFMAACKQAVKANRYLTPGDIRSILSGLDSCDNAATCPHGRPLAVRISRSEIYKRFLRGSI